MALDARAGPTAKYTQPCTGGVYMGVVNVFLGHKCTGDVKVCGDGRMYRCSAGGATLPRYGKKPEVCKYHKLEPRDRPPGGAPKKIHVEFGVYVYTNAAGAGGDMKFDDAMVKYQIKDNYAVWSCTIDLVWEKCLDSNDGYFHEYKFEKVSEAHCVIDGTGERILATEGITRTITSLVALNRYTFEFQTLRAHPSMPGLYFAASAGYPSDELAVLLGGRARNGSATTGENVLFAQHKFATVEWDQVKQIHAAMANVLSKIEYMYNYLLQIPSTESKTTLSTQPFCQQLLDHITEPYIKQVLRDMALLTSRNDAKVSIAHIRGVCEYVFQRQYPFLDASMWTFSSGEFTYTPDLVGMPMQLNNSECETRRLAFYVLSSCIEPEPRRYARGTALLDPVKINAFSAYDVFDAYASLRYPSGSVRPAEFVIVLEDARQLLINMKRLKTSSNFALARLQQSCEAAVKIDDAFKLTRNCMLATSRNFISLLLQRDASTQDEKFGDYVKFSARNLRQNKVCAIEMLPFPQDGIDDFVFENDKSWPRDPKYTSEFEYLLFATQLHVLAGMVLHEKFEQSVGDGDFHQKNYFQFAT